MQRQRSVAAVLAVACVVFSVCPSASGTLDWFPSAVSWDWFGSEDLPNMTFPEVCGVRVPGVEASNMTLQDMKDYPKAPELPVGMPFPRWDLTTTDGSFEPEFPWPWVVRIADDTAGVLISERHVVTLEHCLSNYTRWFGGFYSFGVGILDQDVEVARVDVQSLYDNPLPLALLTLASHNFTRVSSPVCVGPYRHELIAAAVGWDKTGDLKEKPVSIYRKGQCASYHREAFKDDLMLCGSVGARLCGGPLMQVSQGRWMLVALGSGEPAPIARYVRLAPAQKWLESLN